MKETKYAGTQTEKNLMAAFAGESEARNSLPRRADVLGDLLMGHAYGIGAGTLRFGQKKFCQPPIQSLEHDLLHGGSDYPCKCHCGAQGAKSSCPLLPL